MKGTRMTFKASGLVAAFLLGASPVVCQAQDFSADVVYFTANQSHAASAGTASPPHRSSKLYVGPDNIRLETRGLTETILLVTGQDRTTLALFPARKEYQALAAGPSEYFRARDAEDACPDWQKASDQKISCEKVGHETVDGRKAVKYQNKRASEDATGAVWIDPSLKFVIKWEGAHVGAELRNIKEAPQAADLFAVPSDYDVLKPSKAKPKGFGQRKP
jgi:hypothetical protein